ncbi:helix-turn-helix domain-containing protein [Aquisalimonas sp.]|uniref:response regulator transcription factor n=1 Tax=Aquisalimonas sp. TaxID=1872621 RepID=UPI0025B9249D|nr:helix-turn-helix domain-containing protein [Aquisalimonas sp.]
MEAHWRVLVVARNFEEAANTEYLKALVSNGYQVREIARGEDALPVMEQENPLVACFQFDYPDARGLAELRQAKERIPSVPLIMITQAHSESLAVWAFRARVWDYFVQPVDLERFLSVLNALSTVQSAPGRGQRPLTGPLMPLNAMPSELRIRGSGGPDKHGALELAVSYVQRNLDTKIVQGRVAELCGLTPFQFSRLFKRQYDLTFQEFVLQTRITAAKAMLSHPGASVSDVCYSVGFRDLSYFTRTFHRYVGETPSQYRQRVRPCTAGQQPDSRAAMSASGAGAGPERLPQGLLDRRSRSRN